MYVFRQDKIDVKKRIKQKYICKEIGLTQSTLSNIFLRKVYCRKVVAYSITKILDSEAEIEDYFERIK